MEIVVVLIPKCDVRKVERFVLVLFSSRCGSKSESSSFRIACLEVSWCFKLSNRVVSRHTLGSVMSEFGSKRSDSLTISKAYRN